MESRHAPSETVISKLEAAGNRYRRMKTERKPTFCAFLMLLVCNNPFIFARRSLLAAVNAQHWHRRCEHCLIRGIRRASKRQWAPVMATSQILSRSFKKSRILGKMVVVKIRCQKDVAENEGRREQRQARWYGIKASQTFGHSSSLPDSER